jgi:hypothetical protein
MHFRCSSCRRYFAVVDRTLQSASCTYCGTQCAIAWSQAAAPEASESKRSATTSDDARRFEPDETAAPVLPDTSAAELAHAGVAAVGSDQPVLIACPACRAQVSSRALSCPHCGDPVRDQVVPSNGRDRASATRLERRGTGSVSATTTGSQSEMPATAPREGKARASTRASGKSSVRQRDSTAGGVAGGCFILACSAAGAWLLFDRGACGLSSRRQSGAVHEDASSALGALQAVTDALSGAVHEDASSALLNCSTCGGDGILVCSRCRGSGIEPTLQDLPWKEPCTSCAGRKSPHGMEEWKYCFDPDCLTGHFLRNRAIHFGRNLLPLGKPPAGSWLP